MAKSEKVKVIFRKEYNEYTKSWDIVAFMPELLARSGYIICFDKICGHGEAEIWYYHNTKKAMPDEYAELLRIMRNIYGYDVLLVRQKINYKDLTSAWEEERKLRCST